MRIQRILSRMTHGLMAAYEGYILPNDVAFSVIRLDKALALQGAAIWGNGGSKRKQIGDSSVFWTGYVRSIEKLTVSGWELYFYESVVFKVWSDATKPPIILT